MSEKNNQLARAGSDKIAGTYARSSRLNEVLVTASRDYHLVSPATECGALPEGCEVALSSVQIDVDNETYDVGGGKRGLAKPALDKIASAAGVSWDARQSGRLDNGSDHHYVTFQAVATLRHFDGTEIQIIGTKEMDLRDGSAQVEALWERYRAAKIAFDKGTSRAKWPPKEPTAQIREMRLHILAHAESKAKLRATRSIGIRASYTAEELRRPFMVAKLMFTGRTDDPELRRIFAEKRADAMLGGMRALYGSAPAPTTPAPARAYLPPPPVGSTHVDDDDDDVVEVAAIQAPPPAAALPTPVPATSPKASPQPSGEAFLVPFGNDKGRPITEVGDRTLDFLISAFEKSIDDPEKARFRANNERALAAVRAEIARRDAGGASNPPGMGDDDGPY